MTNQAEKKTKKAKPKTVVKKVSKKNQNINININSNNKRSGSRKKNDNKSGTGGAPIIISNNIPPQQQLPQMLMNGYGHQPYPFFTSNSIQQNTLQNPTIQQNTLQTPTIQQNTLPTPTIQQNILSNPVIPQNTTTPIRIISSKMKNSLSTNEVYNSTPNKSLVDNMNALKENTLRNINKLKSDNVAEYKQIQKEELKVNKILNNPSIDDAVKEDAQVKAMNIKIQENEVLDNIREIPLANNAPSLTDAPNVKSSSSLIASISPLSFTDDNELQRIHNENLSKDPNYLLTSKEKQELLKKQKLSAKESLTNFKIANDSLADNNVSSVTAGAHKLKGARTDAYTNLEKLVGESEMIKFSEYIPNIEERLKNNQKLTSEQATLLNKVVPGSRFSQLSKSETIKPVFESIKPIFERYKRPANTTVPKPSINHFGAQVKTLQSTNENTGSESLKQASANEWD